MIDFGRGYDIISIHDTAQGREEERTEMNIVQWVLIGLIVYVCLGIAFSWIVLFIGYLKGYPASMPMGEVFCRLTKGRGRG